MTNNFEKPTPEAKALSLFLMAYKATDNDIKEKAKRINRQWKLVMAGELDKKDYDKKVISMLNTFGGYDEVISKTVKFYIDKTGEWTLKGDDKYCQDAKEVADKMLNK